MSTEGNVMRRPRAVRDAINNVAHVGRKGQADVGNWNPLAFTVKDIDTFSSSTAPKKSIYKPYLKCHIVLFKNYSISL